ncbi:unnamed protein product [Polarella glacialis]|uniref:Uncharacterized protein n=1 Tax=Polarella glacialis TaxID=89957 RepID=A0A813M361_POLGL|nr:unnamed protein product [Polarella glacialis]
MGLRVAQNLTALQRPRHSGLRLQSRGWRAASVAPLTSAGVSRFRTGEVSSKVIDISSSADPASTSALEVSAKNAAAGAERRGATNFAAGAIEAAVLEEQKRQKLLKRRQQLDRKLQRAVAATLPAGAELQEEPPKIMQPSELQKLLAACAAARHVPSAEQSSELARCLEQTFCAASLEGQKSSKSSSPEGLWARGERDPEGPLGQLLAVARSLAYLLRGGDLRGPAAERLLLHPREVLKPLVESTAKAADGFLAQAGTSEASSEQQAANAASAREIVIALSKLGVQAASSGGEHSTGAVATAAYAKAAAMMLRGEGCTTKDWSLAMNALARANFGGAAAAELLGVNLRLLAAEKLEKWPPLDLAMLCNACQRLAAAAASSREEHEPLLEQFMHRVAQAMPLLAGQCSPQDVVHFAAALAARTSSSPTGPPATSSSGPSLDVHSSGLRALLQPQRSQQQARRLVETVTMEGLCAILGACARLGVLDETSAPVFRAAIDRVVRSGTRLEPAHLAHLSHSLSRWLLPQRQAPGVRLDNSPHSERQMHLPALLTRAEVTSVFCSTLCPAVVAVAGKFRETRHVAFVAAAVGQIGSRHGDGLREEAAAARALSALSARLLEDERDSCRAPGALRWERFQGWSLAQLSEAFSSQLANIATTDSLEAHSWTVAHERDACEPGTASARVLESLSAYLLSEGTEAPGLLSGQRTNFSAGEVGSNNNNNDNNSGSPGRSVIGSLRPSDAVRLAGALCWSPQGVAICQAVVSTVCFGGALRGEAEATPRDAALLLGAMRRLELRDSLACRELLQLLHRQLCPGVAGPEDCQAPAASSADWDLAAASTAMDALGRLGCFETDAFGSEQALLAVTCLSWSSMQLLRRTFEPARTGSDLPNLAALAQASRVFVPLARSLLDAAEELPLFPPLWRSAVLEHLAWAACCWLEQGLWSSALKGDKDWARAVVVLCRIAAAPELAQEVWASRLRRRLEQLEPLVQAPRLGSAATVLAALGAAGVDLASRAEGLGAALLEGLGLGLTPTDGLQDPRHAALILPAIAAASCSQPGSSQVTPQVLASLCGTLLGELLRDDGLGPHKSHQQGDAPALALAAVLMLQRGDMLDAVEERHVAVHLLCRSLEVSSGFLAKNRGARHPERRANRESWSEESETWSEESDRDSASSLDSATGSSGSSAQAGESLRDLQFVAVALHAARFGLCQPILSLSSLDLAALQASAKLSLKLQDANWPLLSCGSLPGMDSQDEPDWRAEVLSAATACTDLVRPGTSIWVVT